MARLLEFFNIKILKNYNLGFLNLESNVKVLEIIKRQSSSHIIKNTLKVLKN